MKRTQLIFGKPPSNYPKSTVSRKYPHPYGGDHVEIFMDVNDPNEVLVWPTTEQVKELLFIQHFIRNRSKK